MRFSKRYNRFEDWLSTQDRHTSYIRRITRLHSLYPRASLDQLRGHARAEAKRLSKGTPKPVSARSWNTLSPREQLARERALEVLSHARRSGQSLSHLSREYKISVKTVLRATQGFEKAKGRWKPKKIDHISRIMAINENDKELFIEITDSRYATLIGKYHSAVKEYLNTGNIDVLAEFEGKKVKDSSGKWHTLETDPSAIREINARREEPEFYDIYQVNV
jgi:Mor family transcriptional regulator